MLEGLRPIISQSDPFKFFRCHKSRVCWGQCVGQNDLTARLSVRPHNGANLPKSQSPGPVKRPFFSPTRTNPSVSYGRRRTARTPRVVDGIGIVRTAWTRQRLRCGPLFFYFYSVLRGRTCSPSLIWKRSQRTMQSSSGCGRRRVLLLVVALAFPLSVLFPGCAALPAVNERPSHRGPDLFIDQEKDVAAGRGLKGLSSPAARGVDKRVAQGRRTGEVEVHDMEAER